MEWCEGALDLDPDYWFATTFGDEKKFSLSGPRLGVPVWCKKGKAPQRPTQPHSTAGVHVWCAIGPDGLLPPMRTRGKLNRWGYIDILHRNKELLSPVFYDDGATCHTAHATRRAVKEMGIERVGDTSMGRAARMYEANIMENLWSEIETEVWRTNPQITSNTDLFYRVTEACSRLNETGEAQRQFRLAATSLPSRFARVIAANGDHIKTHT